MALLLFFTIERYLKLVKPDIHYKVLMSKFRLWAGITAIWAGGISFSFVTTPYWITFKVKKLLTKPREMCVFSTIMEPLSGMITLFISQLLAIVVLIVINCILGVKIRRIFQSVRQRLPTSHEQELRNKEILKKVEVNLFIMSNIYALLYIPSLGLSVIDILAFFGQLKERQYKPNERAVFVLVNLAAIYPFCEAVTCFFLNKDLKRLMVDFWNKSIGKVRVSTT
ncbi:hypothetical protein RF11_11987 [Thelohanellus kitauei]|uniref:G-protein coupled receptors family 1 profile domain-containing protein n=1 Tax=Thelohanellus kitauei TaxID=669202 RepID=A0A0C2MPA0_THEKT|nr:hypothetical protein RF11_11987 [Thelohanellus kitauei]